MTFAGRLTIFVASVALVAGADAWAQGPRPPAAVPVGAAPIVERRVVDEVRFIASVEPSIASTVGAEVSGRVTALPVSEGDRVVAERSVLAQLDPTPREIDLREAEAAVAKAREEAEKLRRGYRREEVAQRAAEVAQQEAVAARAAADYGRAQQLHREQLISLAELQRVEAEHLAATQRLEAASQALSLARAGPRPEEIAQADADLAQARARAARVRDEIRRTTVRAPITGFVIKKHVDVGAWVQPGSSVVDLIALDPVFVTGPVGEREIARVQPGQSAVLALDAYPDRVFTGTVGAVVPGGDVASRTFPVKIVVGNPDGTLKAGMFARVAVRVGGSRTALFLPKDAVVRRSGQEHVFLVEGEEARLVRVETGTIVDDLIEVRGPGLSAGRKAVTLGNEFLQPGMKVRLAP